MGWTRTSQGLQYQKLFLFEGVNLRYGDLRFFLLLPQQNISGASNHKSMAPISPCPGMVEGIKKVLYQFLFFREVSIYRDLKTGDILQAWSSIYTGVSNEVFEASYLNKKMQRPQCNPTQVANDPVNAVLHPYVGQHSSSLHHTSFTGDFWLDYPNPLPPDEYPAFSSGPQYQGRFMIF